MKSSVGQGAGRGRTEEQVGSLDGQDLLSSYYGQDTVLGTSHLSNHILTPACAEHTAFLEGTPRQQVQQCGDPALAAGKLTGIYSRVEVLPGEGSGLEPWLCHRFVTSKSFIAAGLGSVLSNVGLILGPTIGICGGSDVL